MSQESDHGAGIERLRERLAEAEEILDAIRRGRIDALVVDSPEGARIFTVAGAERPYRILIEQMGEGAASLSDEGVVLFANRQFATMLGVPESEVAGQCIDDFLSDEDASRFRELSRSDMSEIRRVELTLRRRDDIEVPVYVSASVFEDGGLRSLCIVATDLTECKREEAAKARAEERLRQAQKMEAVGQLTGGIAHEFNNLLTAILGHLDMLERRGTDVAAARNVQGAVRAALRGARLVEQLLAFARRQHLVPQPVDVNRVIAGIRDLLGRSLGETVHIVTTLADDLWSAVADPGQVETIIVNLALNARDAMPAGGALRIRTENVAAPGGSPSHDLAPGEYVRLSVEDEGAGMAPEISNRAIEPFFTTKEVGSSGLGLSQVYGVAKQFGGAIRIESRPGAGTTVHVYLPRAAVAEETAPVRPRRAEAGLVLVVDDDPDVRRTTARLLRELGYAAVEAGEAQQALTLVRDDARIGLLFTDIAMPGMNGIELAERVREQRPGLPVLLMTGYPEAAKLASRRASATILEKPFSVARLADAVGGLLRSGAVR